MAKMTVTGLDAFEAKMNRLANGGTVGATKMAVYDGAAVVTDKIRDNLENLPTVRDVDAIAAYRKGTFAGITGRQKAGLLDSLGVAPMQVTSAEINARIGFDGYNEVKTKRWPNGQPNSMIARSIESGTSFMQKHPFLRPAVNSSRSQAQKKMQETFEKRIEELGG